MIHLPCACLGKTAVRFPANSSHMCCTHFAVRSLSETQINPTALPRCRAPVRAKTAVCGCHYPRATARACMRYWPGSGLVYRCPLLYVCTIFNAIELSSIYFSTITVFHEISTQIQQRACIGKIFARWHLAIATTGYYLFFP